MHSFPVYESNTVTTAHGSVSYRHAGTGEAVVFLHGLSGNSRSFALQFAALSRRYRTIAWDAPGFGDSSLVTPNIDAYADQAAAFLDALRISRACVVGHSMGGVVAARFAARHPQRVSSMLLSCTHTGYGQPADAPMTDGHRQRLDEIKRLDPRDYGQARAPGMVSPIATETTLETVAELASHTRPDGLRNAIRAIFTADNTRDCTQLTMPVTVIAGAHDRIAPAAKTDRLAALIPHSRHVVMNEAGHAPYIEMASAFNSVLQETVSGR